MFYCGINVVRAFFAVEGMNGYIICATVFSIWAYVAKNAVGAEGNTDTQESSLRRGNTKFERELPDEKRGILRGRTIQKGFL